MYWNDANLFYETEQILCTPLRYIRWVKFKQDILFHLSLQTTKVTFSAGCRVWVVAYISSKANLPNLDYILSTPQSTTSLETNARNMADTNEARNDKASAISRFGRNGFGDFYFAPGKPLRCLECAQKGGSPKKITRRMARQDEAYGEKPYLFQVKDVET